MTPYGKGQGGSSSPGASASRRPAARPPVARTTTWSSAATSRSSRTCGAPATPTAAGACLTRSSSATRSRCSSGPRTCPTPTARSAPTGRRIWASTSCCWPGAVGKHSPLKATFPMVPANDIYRDTSFMGGLLDFEFAETYLGLTGALNTVNPVGDSASDPALLSDLGEHRGRPRQRAGQLSRGADREHPQRRRRGLRRLLLAGPQPAERARARRRQPHPGVHGREASSTSSRTASPSTTPSCRTPGPTVRPPRRWRRGNARRAATS